MMPQGIDSAREQMIRAIADAVRKTPMPSRLPTLVAMNAINALSDSGFIVVRFDAKRDARRLHKHWRDKLAEQEAGSA